MKCLQLVIIPIRLFQKKDRKKQDAGAEKAEEKKTDAPKEAPKAEEKKADAPKAEENKK